MLTNLRESKWYHQVQAAPNIQVVLDSSYLEILYFLKMMVDHLPAHHMPIYSRVLSNYQEGWLLYHLFMGMQAVRLLI